MRIIREASPSEMKTKVLSFVKRMLIAGRNSDTHAEQKAYDELRAYCEKNGLDFEKNLEGAKKEIRKGIANNMNGFV